MREFALSGDNLTVGTGTLIFVNPAAAPSCNIQFMRWWIGFLNTATSAQLRVQLGSKASAFPTLVTATPRKLQQADTASTITGGTAGAAGTCGINASAEGAGTFTPIYPDAFNVLNGFLNCPAPDERITAVAGQNAGITMFMPTVFSPTSGYSVGTTFKEI